MAAIQLGFSLRTSTNCKSVHLVGSWDGYQGQLPLAKDAAKAGSWKSTFRFQASTLQAGKRYWYYYMMDGFHVSHDPAKPSTKEPTTGRQLNILDVPKSAATSASAAAKPAAGKRASAHVPQGRALSPSRIVAPKPSKPYASRAVREADYAVSPVDELSSQLEKAELFSSYGGSASPASSISSGSSSDASSLSSLSDRSASSCTCRRYGITRRGDKVLLDCGGSRCGASEDSSSCGDSSDEDEAPAPRRQPVSRSRAAPVASRRR